MTQSLMILTLWIGCILFYSHAQGQVLRKEIPSHEELQHNSGSSDTIKASTPGATSYAASQPHFEKRDLPIRMGLAANPDVLTQDVAPKSRRSKIAHAARSLEDEGEKVQFRPWHMGLAANPDLITQDPSSASPPLRRRSLGKLLASTNEATILRSDPNISDEDLSAFNNEKNSRTSENDSLMHQQPSTQTPLNLNTVGLGKSITFPLYRREKSEAEKDLHPEIHFQKHLHNALRRHATFLEKSIDENVLENNLRKRAESVGWNLGRLPLSRRALAPERLPQNDSQSAGFPASAFAAAKSGTITPANPVTAANSMGLHIEANDVGYFAEVQVGTPPVKFRLIMDTGSSDTWLQLEDCRNLKDSSRSCNHQTLNSQSSTFKRTSSPFSITYGTGKVNGVLIEEKLNMGGLILNNHIFGGVTQASDEFTGKNVPFDGLMGTARSVLSNQKVLTPIEAMAKAGTLTGAFIGYALGRVSDTENIGQVTLGGIDQTKFSGDLTIFPNVNKKGFWEGAMDAVQIGGKTILTDRTGILDTGTTLIVVPAEDAKVVHSQIPGAVSDNKGGFRIPCTNTVKVGLSFGGVVFEINPVDLTFQPVTKNLKGLCISGISVGTVGGPTQWLIGDVFLKNVYFATDVSNNQMGLAVLNQASPKN